MLTQLLSLAALVGTCMAGGYSQDDATKFVGAQHWWESGFYLNGGLKQHYDGFYCLCSCNATDEGIFCQGGGFSKTGTLEGNFMAVYAQTQTSKWEGSILSYGTPHHFKDSFSQDCPSCGANYTGVAQGTSSEPFVWRGYMSGVDCSYKTHCPLCSTSPQYTNWSNTCK